MRQLEASSLLIEGTREGSLLVTEELALHEPRRQRAAVDPDERSVAARAVLVNGTRQQLLSGSGLPEQQHGGVCMGHGFDLRERFLESPAVADDLLEATTRRDLRLQIVALRLQTVLQRRDLGECGFEFLPGHGLMGLVHDPADALGTFSIDVADKRAAVAEMPIPATS